jgi:ABC-type protease/lipase transport system fused ATPase/permease subunit
VKERKAARRESAGLLLAVVLFSVVVNLLMLTRPL